MGLIAGRIFSVVGVLAVLMLGAGCSTFDQRWKAMPQESRSSPLTSVAGAWDGTWQSDKGHGSGKLRAIIETTQAPSTATGVLNEKYEATFRATWAGFMNGEYVVELITVREANGKTRFSGKKDLGGLAGGMYTYDGYVLGDEFVATYTSKGDSGTFTMRRARVTR